MKILVIDCNYLCYRAKFTTGGLSYKGMPTGVIYGFLNQLYTLGKMVLPDETMFIWDSRQSKRRNRYPFYKNRVHTEEPDPELIAAFAQFSQLRKEILPFLGFPNNHMQIGYEADDLIAKFVMNHDDKCITASGDADLYQLLDYTDMYSIPSDKKIKTITKADFMAQYGITPKDWIRVKQIAGCSSDTIPGIYGVGDATAVKYIRGELKEHTKKYKAIKDGQGIIKRNRWLVKLPLPGTNDVEMSSSQFDRSKLRQVCQEFGFTKLYQDYNKLDEWQCFFGSK